MGEEELQREWRESVARKLDEVSRDVKATRELVLKADLDKLGDHEIRLRKLEEFVRDIRSIGELDNRVKDLESLKNKILGGQAVILFVWAIAWSLIQKFWGR